MLTVQKWQVLAHITSLLFPGFVPVCSVGVNQVGRLKLGHPGSLRYLSVCGHQEGYQPFAHNMSRDVPLWMSWKQPHFTPVPPDHGHIQVAFKTSAASTDRRARHRYFGQFTVHVYMIP